MKDEKILQDELMMSSTKLPEKIMLKVLTMLYEMPVKPYLL